MSIDLNQLLEDIFKQLEHETDPLVRDLLVSKGIEIVHILDYQERIKEDVMKVFRVKKYE